MSASIVWLVSVTRFGEGVMPGALLIQARHSLHVSMICGIIDRIDAGSPAARKAFSMEARVACHHRMCSFLNSFFFWASVPVLNTRKDVVMSKDVQSEELSPTALSAIVGCARLNRCAVSGPRGVRRGRVPPSGTSTGPGSPSVLDELGPPMLGG